MITRGEHRSALKEAFELTTKVWDVHKGDLHIGIDAHSGDGLTPLERKLARSTAKVINRSNILIL